jgi:hypothetical protein
MTKWELFACAIAAIVTVAYILYHQSQPSTVPVLNYPTINVPGVGAWKRSGNDAFPKDNRGTLKKDGERPGWS